MHPGDCKRYVQQDLIIEFKGRMEGNFLSLPNNEKSDKRLAVKLHAEQGLRTWLGGDVDDLVLVSESIEACR